MPVVIPAYENGYDSLFERGCERAELFCKANNITMPKVKVMPWTEWYFAVPAYYRPDDGIVICVRKCALLAPVAQCRLWSWPASTTDRTPYGVVAHELAHHCDWTIGTEKGRYYSTYSNQVMLASGEKSITSYDGHLPHEWFAECFRLFITNASLLKSLRPKTYNLFIQRWKPVSHKDWRYELGPNVPPRIITALKNKGAV